MLIARTPGVTGCRPIIARSGLTTSCRFPASILRRSAKPCAGRRGRQTRSRELPFRPAGTSVAGTSEGSRLPRYVVGDTVAEALWLQDRGVDIVIAQGYEAGGHPGMFLTPDVNGA